MILQQTSQIAYDQQKEAMAELLDSIQLPED
jgi:hypothetical protein